MKNSLRILLIMGLVLAGMGLGRAWSKNSSPREMIRCQDGDVFYLEEWRSIEAVDSDLVKNERIQIDTQKLRLTFFRDDKEIASYPVAIGDTETPTPAGEWKIIHKGGNWGDGFGARWLGLNVPWGIYGIHGTNKPGTVGTRSSHGCIRMFNQNVLHLYEMVKLGTPVVITGTPRAVPVRREMALNSSGEDVILVQYRLRKIGLEPGALDGRFKAEMQQAVMQLQAHYGLAVTGRLGPNERALLGLK